jgi:hypothetical protein
MIYFPIFIVQILVDRAGLFSKQGKGLYSPLTDSGLFGQSSREFLDIVVLQEKEGEKNRGGKKNKPPFPGCQGRKEGAEVKWWRSYR